MLTELTRISLKTMSDKSFWHKYTESYSPVFEQIKKTNPNPIILEYGVFKGDSIRLYLDYFENPTIYAVDWLEEKDIWPKSEKVTYFRADQSKRNQIKDVLKKINKKFDLVIEDGGHRPDQQYNSLIETLPYIKDGTTYILEDLHTSLVGHPLNKILRTFGERFPGNCYNLLVAIKHLKELIEIGEINIDEARTRLANNFHKNAIIPKEDRLLFFERMKEINIYKRIDLPLMCWNCQKHNYDYQTLRCTCGKELIGIQDSLTSIIKF